MEIQKSLSLRVREIMIDPFETRSSTIVKLTNLYNEVSQMSNNDYSKVAYFGMSQECCLAKLLNEIAEIKGYSE